MAVDSYSFANNEPCTHNSQCLSARCNQHGKCETASSYPGRQCNPNREQNQCGSGNKCDKEAWRCMPTGHSVRPGNCTKAYDCPRGDYCPGMNGECVKAKPTGGRCDSQHDTFLLGRECEDGSWCYEGVCRKRWSTKHLCAESELSVDAGEHTAPVCLPKPQAEKPPAPVKEPPTPVEEEPEEEDEVIAPGSAPRRRRVPRSAPPLPSTAANHSWPTKIGLPEMTTKQLAMLGGSIALIVTILVLVILGLRKCRRKPKDDDERKADMVYSPMMPSVLPPTYSPSQPAALQSAGGASYMTTPAAGEKPTKTGEKQGQF